MGGKGADAVRNPTEYSVKTSALAFSLVKTDTEEEQPSEGAVAAAVSNSHL